MTVQTYLARPVQYSAAQWNGTNVAEVNTVCQLADWSFTGDNGGTAHTGTGNFFTVDMGLYLVAGSTGIQIMDSTAFSNQFVPGSSWVVSA